MKKSRIVIAAALVLGVAAAVPGGPRLSYDLTVFSATEGGGGAHPRRGADPTRVYRPCRPGPGDDRCIQLYERGVREALAARGGHVRTALRPCRPGPGDDRCIQLYERRVRAGLAARGHRPRVAAAPLARRRIVAARPVRRPVAAQRPRAAAVARPPARTAAAVRRPAARSVARPGACARVLTDDCVARFDRARTRSRRNGEPSTPGI
jgi:hypothetical protein